MHLATVIGTVWATARHPSLGAASLRILQPEDATGRSVGAPIVAVDTMGAGVGERVFFVTAREAVLAMRIPEAPVDASIVGIVEGVS